MNLKVLISFAILNFYILSLPMDLLPGSEYLAPLSLDGDVRGCDQDLIGAIEIGDLITISELIEDGVNINCEDEDSGKTPLYIAFEDGQAAVMDLLLRGGANVNAKNRDGQTPLFLAVTRGLHQMINFLIKKGADVNIQDNKKEAPLFLAVGDLAAVNLLLSAGADVGMQRKDGMTPLHVAILGKNNAVIERLIHLSSAFRAINSVDVLQRTPLHLAVLSGNKNVVIDLLEIGADWNVADKNGHTPLALARKNGRLHRFSDLGKTYDDIVKILKSMLKNQDRDDYTVKKQTIPKDFTNQDRDGILFNTLNSMPTQNIGERLPFSNQRLDQTN